MKKLVSALAALSLGAALLTAGGGTARASSHREAPMLFRPSAPTVGAGITTAAPAVTLAVKPTPAPAPSPAPTTAPATTATTSWVQSWSLYTAFGMHPFMFPAVRVTTPQASGS